LIEQTHVIVCENSCDYWGHKTGHAGKRVCDAAEVAGIVGTEIGVIELELKRGKYWQN
jgi:hypothetical protein